MQAGLLNKKVTLARSPQSTPDSDGFWEALTPDSVYAAIQPLAPAEDGRTITHAVTIRFHPQVTVDTKVAYFDPVLNRTRDLMVMGVQNVDERNVEMRLLCQEVQ